MKDSTIFTLLMLIVLAAGCCDLGDNHVVTEGNVTTPFVTIMVVTVEPVDTSNHYKAGSFDPVRSNKDDWVCYDHSIIYAREHPRWGIVMMSNNSGFRGISHMVNYMMVDEYMLIHDEMNGYNCYFKFDQRTTDNPYYECTYYKFWNINETPLRTYGYMRDNSAEWVA